MDMASDNGEEDGGDGDGTKRHSKQTTVNLSQISTIRTPLHVRLKVKILATATAF